MPPRNRHRWDSDLYMDGPSLISFTVDAIPGLVDDILEKLESTNRMLTTSSCASNLQDAVGISSTHQCASGSGAFACPVSETPFLQPPNTDQQMRDSRSKGRNAESVSAALDFPGRVVIGRNLY